MNLLTRGRDSRERDVLCLRNVGPKYQSMQNTVSTLGIYLAFSARVLASHTSNNWFLQGG